MGLVKRLLLQCRDPLLRIPHSVWQRYTLYIRSSIASQGFGLLASSGKVCFARKEIMAVRISRVSLLEPYRDSLAGTPNRVNRLMTRG
jgi:hypothetical protein